MSKTVSKLQSQLNKKGWVAQKNYPWNVFESSTDGIVTRFIEFEPPKPRPYTDYLTKFKHLWVRVDNVWFKCPYNGLNQNWPI